MMTNKIFQIKNVMLFGFCLIYSNGLHADCCSSQEFIGDSLLSGAYIKGTVGEGIDTPSAYLTLGTFAEIPLFQRYANWSFLDLRGHYFHRDQWAGNIGLAIRNEGCNGGVIGFNAFYDFRKSECYFQQLGFGAEWLGCCYNLRANVYIPIGHRTECIQTVWEERCECFEVFDPITNCITTECFTDNSGCIDFFTQKRKTLFGFDAEIERVINQCYCPSVDLIAAIGGYYYKSQHCRDIVGARFRVDGSYFPYLDFGAIITYDDHYHCRFQTYISFNFISGLFGRCFDQCAENCCDWICDQPILRQELIVRGKKYWNCQTSCCD